MLMILARLVRSESFWAVVKVRSPHTTGPGISYIIARRPAAAEPAAAEPAAAAGPAAAAEPAEAALAARPRRRGQGRMERGDVPSWVCVRALHLFHKK